MSKRCHQFKRRAQDAYDTPAAAVVPLIPHLPRRGRYWEPCAGAGKLAAAITDQTAGGLVGFLSDIEPRAPGVRQRCGLDPAPFETDHRDLIITNPPWTRTLLHPMIDHWRQISPVWLLFDADWAHTKQAAPYLAYCWKIVSVGRVSWMENGTSGFDNCAWYLFGARPAVTVFCGRGGA